MDKIEETNMNFQKLNPNYLPSMDENYGIGQSKKQIAVLVAVCSPSHSPWCEFL